MSQSKCIIILSHKSSGSSALQNLLSVGADVRIVEKSRHFENETLYWTKAASVLGLPQETMINSEVPIAAEKAREDLYNLLKDNLPSYSKPEKEKDLIFGGWELLCEYYSPIFLEKSPHHLFQWSALELIIECMEFLDSNVDFLLVGLVRNPMDMLYSSFRRLKTSPEKLQFEWHIAYQNLLKIKEILGDKVVIVRYEDLVSSIDYIKPIFDFCGSCISDIDPGYLHQRSINKWKNDKLYRFSLSTDVFDLAQRFGYSQEQLINSKTTQHSDIMYLSWILYRSIVTTIGTLKRIKHSDVKYFLLK